MIGIGLTDLNKEDALWLLEDTDICVYVNELETKKLVYMNSSCKKLFGISEEQDITQLCCYEIMHRKTQPCSFCPTVTLSESKFYEWEYFNHYIGEKHFIFRDQLIKWDNKMCRMQQLIDVTTKEKMEKLISENISIENTLLDCLNTITKFKKNETEMMQNILSTICNFYKADRAFIIQGSEDMCYYRYLYVWSKNGNHHIEYEDKKEHKSTPYENNIYKNKCPIIIKNIEEIKEVDPIVYHRLKMRGVKSLYSVPYIINGKIQGYVGIDNPTLHIGNYTFLKTLSLFICNLMYQLTLLKKQEYHIYHDKVTGLPNRNSYLNEIKKLKKMELKELGVAVANINGLEQTNFDFGFEYGDSVLRTVATTLSDNVTTGSVFRFEGDEFIIFCPNVTYMCFQEMIDRVRGQLKAHVSNVVSLGYSWTEREEKDINWLVHEATDMMLSNKRQYYDQLEISSRHNNINNLLNLKREMSNGNFQVYLQPKIDSRTNELKGMEALVRYIDTKHGVVVPSKFIPLLEKKGILSYLDYYVFDQVCTILQQWKDKGYPSYPISLNFSRKTIKNDNLLDEINKIVSHYSINRKDILIEVTESAGDMEQDIFIDIGSKLMHNGFGLSLDDFCSKYSCPSLLATLPFDEIKFDKSMIDEITTNEKMKILCMEMMGICKKLGHHILAEGVETKEQVEMLKEFNCYTIQGYYYSKPISVEEFEKKYLIKNKGAIPLDD